MKKLLFLLLFVPFVSIGQSWIYDQSIDPFDGKESTLIHYGFGGQFPYKNPVLIFRYTHNTNELEIYIDDLGYSGCDDNYISMSFNDNPENVYSYSVNESKDKSAVFFEEDDFVPLIMKLKKYSFVSVRFSNSCDNKRFKFNLKGSSNALNKFLGNSSEYNIKSITTKIDSEKSYLKNKKSNIKKLILQAKQIADWNYIDYDYLESFEYSLNKNYERHQYDSITLFPDGFLDYKNTGTVLAYYVDKTNPKWKIEIKTGTLKAKIKDEFLEDSFLNKLTFIEKAILETEYNKIKEQKLFLFYLEKTIKEKALLNFKDIRFDLLGYTDRTLKTTIYDAKIYLETTDGNDVRIDGLYSLEDNSPLIINQKNSVEEIKPINEIIEPGEITDEQINQWEEDKKQEDIEAKEYELNRIRTILLKYKRDDIIDLFLKTIDNRKKVGSSSKYGIKYKLSDVVDVKVRFSRYSSGKIWKADITLNFKNNKQYSIPVFDLHKLETPVKMKDLRKMKGKYAVYF